LLLLAKDRNLVWLDDCYGWRDGQAELAWVAGLNTKMVYPRPWSPIPALTGPDVEQLVDDNDVFIVQ